MAIATEDFIKQIDEMSVLDLNNLVKALETEWLKMRTVDT